MYVNEALKHFYNIDNKIKISPVYLGGKSNYNHRKIEGEIKKMIKSYSQTNGNSIVFYFIDKDQFDSSYEDKKFLSDVQKYCEINNIELVYFVRDVENVFLGKQIEAASKTKAAINFIRKNAIVSVAMKTLSNEVGKIGTSNLLCILDKYLENYKINR